MRLSIALIALVMIVLCGLAPASATILPTTSPATTVAAVDPAPEVRREYLACGLAHSSPMSDQGTGPPTPSQDKALSAQTKSICGCILSGITTVTGRVPIFLEGLMTFTLTADPAKRSVRA
jgi:hypothetical protein